MNAKKENKHNKPNEIKMKPSEKVSNNIFKQRSNNKN
jgi:hypothetical protein